MSIPVFRSYIKRKDMDTVLSCLMTDAIGPGPYLERFQKSAREFFGFEYGLFVRSPIEAARLALEVMDVGAGDSIVMSALAPRWLASAARKVGIATIWADVNKDTGNPAASDFDTTIATVEPKPKLLILAGGGGVLPDENLSEELGLPIIEDFTRSVGGTRAGLPAKAIGTIGVLSLEHGSPLTAGGGAMIFANGKREAAVLRNLAEGLLQEEKMPDYNAALGLAQLRELENCLEKRRELRKLFYQALAGKRHGSFMQAGEAEAGTWSFPVVIESSTKDAVAYARKKDIETELAFADSCVAAGLLPEGSCPNARSLSMRTLLFPLHQRIGNAGAQKITRVLATLP